MIHRHLAFLSLAGTLIAAPVVAFAQTAPTPATPGVLAPQPHQPGIMKEALAGLALSDSQRAQLATYAQQFRASKKTPTPETHAQYNAQIESVLTPEQRTALAASIRQIRRQRQAERNAAAPLPAPTT